MGRWEWGVQAVAGREVGLDGRRDAVEPWRGAPCSQECNGSVSLVALIPSSLKLSCAGAWEQAEAGSGGAIR